MIVQNFKNLLQNSGNAVSYTHLDVYKRQSFKSYYIKVCKRNHKCFISRCIHCQKSNHFKDSVQ